MIRRDATASTRRRACGFTLIELLVTIGIIAILAGLLLPAVISSLRSGTRSRTQMDLQSISTALTQYKTDFGAIPNVPVDNTGFAVLAKALVGPGPAEVASVPSWANVTERNIGTFAAVGTQSYVALTEPTGAPPGAATDWVEFSVEDGVDGPGFRTITGGSPRNPYLDVGRFQINGSAIVDAGGKPFLYFPARQGSINVRITPSGGDPGYVGDTTGAGEPVSRWDAGDNLNFFRQRDVTGAYNRAQRVETVRFVFGDYDVNGQIDAGENAYDGDFVLYAAGPDGVYGPTDWDTASRSATAASLDDVTNFGLEKFHNSGSP